MIKYRFKDDNGKSIIFNGKEVSEVSVSVLCKEQRYIKIETPYGRLMADDGTIKNEKLHDFTYAVFVKGPQEYYTKGRCITYKVNIRIFIHNMEDIEYIKEELSFLEKEDFLKYCDKVLEEMLLEYRNKERKEQEIEKLKKDLKISLCKVTLSYHNMYKYIIKTIQSKERIDKCIESISDAIYKNVPERYQLTILTETILLVVKLKEKIQEE